MKSYNGIDVSEHNGSINWKKVKPHIHFAMLRAGFGSSTFDANFKVNASNCSSLKIPFGVYWFSYAYTEDMARKEAKRCLAAVKPFHLSCPIAFDFEEDSLKYAERNGVNLTPSQIAKIADAFLTVIANEGYPVLLYTNINMWKKGLCNLKDCYPIWCAQWGVDKPDLYCTMWQDSNKGRIEGITGEVDTNISYVNYPLQEMVGITNDRLKYCVNKYGDTYTGIAHEIIEGKYGNGTERVNKLLAEHRDPEYAQEIVNILLS